MIEYIENKLMSKKLYRGFLRYQFEFDYVYRHMFEYDKLEFLVKFLLGLLRGKKQEYLLWYHMDIFVTLDYNSDVMPLSEKTKQKLCDLRHKFY